MLSLYTLSLPNPKPYTRKNLNPSTPKPLALNSPVGICVAALRDLEQQTHSASNKVDAEWRKKCQPWDFRAIIFPVVISYTVVYNTLRAGSTHAPSSSSSNAGYCAPTSGPWLRTGEASRPQSNCKSCTKLEASVEPQRLLCLAHLSEPLLKGLESLVRRSVGQLNVQLLPRIEKHYVSRVGPVRQSQHI